MKRLRALALIPGTFLLACTLAHAEHRPNELIVKYKDDVRRDYSIMNQLYESLDVVKVKRFPGVHGLEQLVLAPGANLNKVLDMLNHNAYVEYAEPNAILRALPIAARDARAPRPHGGDGENPPCVPGMPIPGCTPMPCLAPNFPPGCSSTEPGNPTPPADPVPPTDPAPPTTQRPTLHDRPGEVNPPVADPMMASAWGIGKVGADEAWKTTRGSPNIVVAVIDTGVDYNHEDLGYNIWRNPNVDPKANDVVGYDFIHNDGLPFDDHSHGSHCSGVIGAVGGNGKGVSGINQRVSIMGVKFLGADGSGDEASAIRAIDYAVSHGARVLSNSWGGSGDLDTRGLRDAVARAEARGVLFVAAAGNESSDNDTTPEFPGGFNAPNELTVAATDSSDALAYFSNTGAKSVQLAAPGVDIYSTTPGDKYEKMSGTSMACPHVAGAAALVWSAHPDWTYDQVKKRLLDTVDPLPSLAGKTLTGGRLNVSKAVAP